MHKVFLRSTLRQPVKTAVLLLVAALITFAFVARVSEYLLIKQETERLSGQYRSIGFLEPMADRGNLSSRLLEYLGNSPYIKTVEEIRYGSAVADVYSLEADDTDASYTLHEDMFFYGTFEYVSSMSLPVPGSDERQTVYYFYFTVDEAVAGYPELIQAGDTVALINTYEDSVFALFHNEHYTDLTPLLDELEIGGRYLLRGEMGVGHSICKKRDNGSSVYLFKPLATLVHAGTGDTLTASTGQWYFPVEPGESADFDDPRLAGVADVIRLFDDNQHALHTIGSQDVSALAASWQDGIGPYLTSGRWLDSEDDAEGRRCCVVHESLAAARGLSVGDTLNLSLRDLTKPYTVFLWMPDDLSRMDEMETSKTEPYEIVGIYNTLGSSSFLDDYIFIPASAYPESFQYGYYGCANSFETNIWFELASPDVVHQFNTEAQAELELLGVQAVVHEIGWESFQAAAKPMRQSSLVNALVFSGILLAVLSLLTVIYCRMRRKDIAIARALGVPVRQCVPQAALPLLLAGGLGILTGGWIGWRNTLANARTALRSLEEFGSLEGAGLSSTWLAVLCGGELVLLAVLALGGVWLTARVPALTLLQGGAAVKAQKPVKVKPVKSPAAIRPAVVPAAAPASIPAPVAGRSLGAAHILRFVWRHIARAKVKTALTVLLAAGFMAGMASIRIAVEDSKVRVEELYNSTVVEMELVQTGNTAYRNVLRDLFKTKNFISADAVNAVRDTGFVLDGYLEGSKSASVFPYDGEWVRGQSVMLTDGLTSVTVEYFNDLEEYRNQLSRFSITYHDGWDETLFAQDWAAVDSKTPDDAPALFPVVLPENLYEELGIQMGDTVGVHCGGFRLCEVVGTCTGGSVLMPCSAVEVMAGNNMAYSKATFSLDPAQNRQIDQFQAAVYEIIEGTKNTLPLRMVVWDDELRYTVGPLEDSVALMELLYPVVLALSLLVAAGIAVLFVMTSAKEAAIMRVLGTSKLKSRLMLALQTVFTSLAGLAAGLLGILAYTGWMRPDLFANLLGVSALCAMLYLLAAILGAAVSASAVTARNPLELLQVKE